MNVGDMRNIRDIRNIRNIRKQNLAVGTFVAQQLSRTSREPSWRTWTLPEWTLSLTSGWALMDRFVGTG